MRRSLLPIIVACAALAIAGCGGDDESSSTQSTTEAAAQSGSSANQDTSKKPQVTVPDGEPPAQLEETDIVTGDGATAKKGDQVTVNYVGVGYDSEEEFDASWGRGPFTFTLGTGEVIPGWDEGVAGMKVGGRRELVIPPELAYGPQGAPPAIGPNETLIFVVDLVSVG